jgi:hypothetical protein
MQKTIFFSQLKLIYLIELETKDVFSNFYPLNIVHQLSHKMEQPILDTNAGKQLSYAATDF